jgi:hypothetical protein
MSADNFDKAKGGIKLDGDKPRTDLLPPDVILQVSAVFTYGANKYGDRNWEKGGRWGRWMAAALRHCFAWLAGEDNDPESGLPHLAHALCSLMMLFGMQLRRAGEDDRHPIG